MSSFQVRSIGLIGYGRFGQFLHALAKRFVPGIEIRIHADPSAPNANLDHICASDVVVLAVPIGQYETVLKDIVARLSPRTVLLDVATVKEYTGELIRQIAPDQAYVSTHPMFGPESYAKKDQRVDGLRIVITETNLPGPILERVCAYLDTLGFSVVRKSPCDHDRDLAETLFLTHYVGQVIARAGFERTDIDTASFGFLMDAVDAVRHDTELFREVLRFNPHCHAVIEKFDRCENAVKSLLLDEKG